MKKKKDRHEWGAGSVSQCGTGWRVRIRLPDGRRVGEVVATKEEEAEKLRDALVAERAVMAREGAFAPRAGKTLEGGPLRLRYAVELAGVLFSSAADRYTREASR